MKTLKLGTRHWIALGAMALLTVLSCVMQGSQPDGVQLWWKARGPVVPHDSFPSDCSLCHEGTSWNSIRSDFQFDHEKETGYKLEGAHAAAECLRCHNDRGPVSMFSSRGCGGCHEDPHRTQLGADCSSCHEQENWKPNEILAMHSRTRFPLIGAHAVAACTRCHPGADSGNFGHTDTRCEACHQADLQRTTLPNNSGVPDHLVQGWTSDCQRCHVSVAWGGGSFNHSAWPLTGKHKSADCTECHPVPGDFTSAPTQCDGCHLGEYQGTTDPNHGLFGFSTDCRQCHGTSTWSGARFPHTGIVDGCVQCHLPDYQGTSAPDHQQYNFPQTCEQCHVSTVHWNINNFNHAGIVGNCVDCHLPDYVGTTAPDHQVFNLPQTCEVCHTTNSWNVSNFNHSGITNNCVQCHQADYQGTNAPNHQQFGFPQVCEQCHNSTTTWTINNFNHGGITNNCSACHLPDYQGASQPNHTQFNFSQVWCWQPS